MNKTMNLCGSKRKYSKQEVKKVSQDFLKINVQRYPYHCCVCQQYHLSKQINLIDEPLEVMGELEQILRAVLENNKTYNQYRISNERMLHHVKIDGIKYGFIYNKQTDKLILQLMIEE